MTTEFKNYRKKNVQPMRPWREGDDLAGVSISPEDEENGSPKDGDMIAVSPTNNDDRWLVSAEFFAANYVEE